MMDVARRAGVSIATVSRALRGGVGVSSATSERVHRVAAELSYVISPEASGLSSGHTGRVAVVVPHLDSWLHGAMLASMAPVLQADGLELLVYQVDGPEQRALFFQELPARRKADALIVAALPMDQEDLRRLEVVGVHVVVAGGPVHDHPHVRVDQRRAGGLAVRHLLGLGHRRIAMIRTDEAGDTPLDDPRVRAWRETLAMAGVAADRGLLVTERSDPEAGARAVAPLLRLRRPPTAVLAESDELAIAAVAHLRSLGRRVPEDLSVAGIGGHPLGELLGLTTVDVDVVGQGRSAAELVIRLLDGERVSDVEVGLRLVERSSTAPPAA